MTIKLDHINLTVASLPESIEWYRRVFDFEQVELGTTPSGVRWGIVAFNDSMICMTEYSGRVAADNTEDKVAHKICHFGLRVSDMERWKEVVQKNRLKLFYGGQIGYPNSKSWYIHDPSGHEIEVSYSPQGRLQFSSGSTL